MYEPYIKAWLSPENATIDAYTTVARLQRMRTRNGYFSAHISIRNVLRKTVCTQIPEVIHFRSGDNVPCFVLIRYV